MIPAHLDRRADRVAGAVVGSAGGGGWDPGEATDDTQMAVPVGESLLERVGLDLPDVFDRFRRWTCIDAVPGRWTGLLYVPLPGYGDRVLRVPDLLALAERLDSEDADKGHISAE